jgi:magnesium chelatase family protein
MEGGELNAHCSLDDRGTAVLEAAMKKFCLSARGCDRMLRVSRTIADLAGIEAVSAEHVAEALQYRFTAPSD